MPFLASQSRRISSLLVPTLVLAVIISEMLNSTIYSARELRDMRESAVAMANLGQFESALERLRALSELVPFDAAIRGDYLAVLIRANQAETALNLYRGDPGRPLPDYAYAELFGAAVKTADLPLARELADKEIAQSADAMAVAQARALALAEAALIAAGTVADSDAAESTASPPVAGTEQVPQQDPAPVQLASPPQTITQINEVVEADSTPARSPAPLAPPPQRDQPPEAIATAATAEPSPLVPTVIADNDVGAINQAAATARQAVREAETAMPDQRAAMAERALRSLDAYAAVLDDADASAIELRNEKLDRLRALTLAGRYDEAGALFESLGVAASLPVFGLLYGADLYIRLEQPDKAAVLLELARAQEPANRSVLLTQFYLELNREAYDKAQAFIDALRASASTANEQRELRLLDAQLSAYANRLQQAQQELEALRAEDSESGEVRQRLAQLYRWRGWPRRALQEYRQAENLAAEPGTAQLGAVSALVDMHSYMDATETLAAVAQSTPQHPELATARNEQQQRQRWEYSTRISAGNSSDSPITGAGNIALDQRLVSAPIAGHVRLFAHQRYDWAEFREGSTNLNRLGLGIDYRSRQLDAAIEINQRNRGGNTGVSLGGEWHFDDRFSAFADFSSDNSATPLRGLRSGVKGNSRGFGLLFRAHEGSQTLARYNMVDLSDGNERESFMLRQQNTWFLSDRRRLRLTAEAYYGDSSAGDDDVAYYNPAGEKAATLTFELLAPISTSADPQWLQRFAAGTGAYQQESFGTSALWDIEYEQILRLRDSVEINLGLLYRSRVYAGDREGYTALSGGLVWRF